MGTDVIDTKTIEATVARLVDGALEHHLVDYNGDNVHKNDYRMMPQGCSFCRLQPGGVGQERGDVEPHKHYHLWMIRKNQKGERWIHLTLISQFANEAAFREYAEAGGPFYYTCPVEYIDRVPEPEPAIPRDAQGWTWRMHVRRYAKLTQARQWRRAKRAAADRDDNPMMQSVITVQNVYTRATHTVCRRHNDDGLGDVQIQHGWHTGQCDSCEVHKRGAR